MAALRRLPAIRATEDRRPTEHDYRTKTFSCSKCGAAAYVAIIEPIKETGMEDYRLDEIEAPQRHPIAVDRLTGRHRSGRVDHSGGELPGRKVDPHR